MGDTDAEKIERVCRCEAAVPSQLMDGFACGSPDCWRTEDARSSFEAFVADVVHKREADVSLAAKQPGDA